MKKVTSFFVACALAVSAYAEGYQVNLQSAKQTGMGHVGVAMKLGAESMHFNPAALVFNAHTVDLSAGVSGVFANATYKNNTTGIKEKTDNTASTPLYAYAGFKIYDNLAAGISFTTPYGSGLNWGKNWSGADFIQDISLKAYVIQPTLSYKILDKLSIGTGLNIAFGDVSLSRALLPVGGLAAFGSFSLPGIGDMIATYSDVAPISATLTGKSKTGFGFNVGVMYDINDQVTIGASFRSKVNLKVKAGTAEMQYAGEDIKTLVQTVNAMLPTPVVPPLEEGTFQAEMPLPANLNIGVTYKPNDRLLLSAEAQAVFWKAYKELNIHFNEAALKIEDIYARKNYKNVAIYRVGVQYAATSRFDVRGGLYYDQSPIREDYYNPETPGMDKIGISAGFSFRPVSSLSIDFAFLYIQGLGRDGSYTDPRSERTFEGHYTSNAFTPSIGLTYQY